jgi:hypothetical protein
MAGVLFEEKGLCFRAHSDAHENIDKNLLSLG